MAHRYKIIDNILDGQGDLFDPRYAHGFPHARRREIEFVLLACRWPVIESETRRLLVLLDEPLEWPFVFKFARSNGLLALFLKRVKALNLDVIPTDLFEIYSKFSRQWAHRSAYDSLELVRLIKLFEEHQIPVIPFKGPTLSMMLYNDFHMRNYCDLDILIQKHHIQQAAQLLCSCGITLYDSSGSVKTDVDGIDFTSLLTEAKDLFFTRADGLAIEVHWELMLPSKPFIRSSEAIWQSATSATLLGYAVRQFSPEDMFVFLCVHHGVFHLYPNLQMVCDLAQLLHNHPRLDWDRVFAISQEWDCLRAVLLGCLLARIIRGVALPPSVIHRLKKDRWIQSIAWDVISWLFENNNFHPSLGYAFMFYFRIKSSWRARLHLLKCLIFTPRQVDTHLLQLPGKLSFIYTIVRPLRLFWALIRNKKYMDPR